MAGCSATERPPDRGKGDLCAIHQPNLFPRLSTLAKLYAADCWVVLDDVQFARRDYQHRALLGSLPDQRQRQWLTLPTHLPRGRPTLIHEARLVDPAKSRRKVALLLRQFYGTSPFWPCFREALRALLDLMQETDHADKIAETSTRLLLDLLGWRGCVVRSSTLPSRSGRSERLADLAGATGAVVYLCGTGGMQYLQPEAFRERAIEVAPFRIPTDGGPWTGAREISALWALMSYGPREVARYLRT